MMKYARGYKQEQARRRFVEALRRTVEQIRKSGHFLIDCEGCQ